MRIVHVYLKESEPFVLHEHDDVVLVEHDPDLGRVHVYVLETQGENGKW